MYDAINAPTQVVERKTLDQEDEFVAPFPLMNSKVKPSETHHHVIAHDSPDIADMIAPTLLVHSDIFGAPT